MKAAKNSERPSPRQHYLRTIAVIAGLILARHASAADFTWDAGGDGILFNDGANWTGDTVPTQSTATQIIFGDGDPGGLSGDQSIFMETARLIGKLTFAADDANYLIDDLGGRLIINASGFANEAVVNNDESLRTIGVQVNFSGNAASYSVNAASGDLAFIGNFVLGNNTITATGANDVTLGGAVSGVGGLAKIGAGTLTLGAANTFSGGLNASGGTTVLATDSAAGTGTIDANGATLQASGNRTISNPLTIGAGGVTIGGADQMTLAGLVSGSTLTKDGTGTLTIGGANNTFTGLEINDGTVVLGADNALADTAAITFNGSTLDTSGRSETVGTVTVNSAAAQLLFQLGAGATVRFADLVLNPGGVLTLFNHGGAFDEASTDNKLFVTASIGDVNGFVDGIVFDGVGTRGRQLGSGEVVPVPEPRAVAAAVGLLGFALWRFLARRKASEAVSAA